MAMKSQLSVPLSQNTAPVFKFDCLYTHDLVRKQKRWQDGILAFHTFNKRVMVYDLTNNFIGDTHWRETEFVQVGDDLRLDRGVLVEVGEARGRKEQDISEIFAKKNAPVREPSSPLVPIRSSGQKPRSISAVLEASKRGVSRATRAPPPPFVIPGGSSPCDFETQRSPKRRKLTDEAPPRQALAERAIQNRPAIQPISNRIRPVAASAKPAEQTARINTAHVEPQTTTSKAREDSRPIQPQTKPQTKQTKRTKDDAPSAAQKSRKKPEHTGVSKPSKANKTFDTVTERPGKGSREKPGKSKNNAPVTPTESVSIDLTNSDRPRPKLLASKSRRRKLIFQEMLPPEKDPTPLNSSRSRKTSRATAQSNYLVNEESQDHVAREPPRQDIIVISSPVKDWAEFGISEDGEGEVSRTSRKSFTKAKATVDLQPEPCLSEHPGIEPEAQPVRATDLTPRVQTADQGESVDDIEDLTRLIDDENLLASLMDDPVQAHTQEHHTPFGDKEDSHIPTAASDKITKDLHLRLEEADETPEVIETAAVDVNATTTFPHDHTADTEVEVPLSAVTGNKNKPTLNDTTVSIAELQEHRPTRTDTSAPQTTIPIAEETQTRADPPIPPALPEPQTLPQPPPPLPAEESNPQLTDPPTVPNPDLPPARQALPKPLAPLAALLRPTNSALPNLPLLPQKPLPQFRPPQQTALPTGVARSRRSPLQKSLSATTDAPAASVGESTIASLVRAGSDGAVRAAAYTPADYDKTGPWSREAFDLFGWTPDVPKGRVLGPVAGRACGCRAAAAAAIAAGDKG